MGQIINNRSYSYDSVEIANKKYDSAVTDYPKPQPRPKPRKPIETDYYCSSNSFPYLYMERCKDMPSVYSLSAVPVFQLRHEINRISLPEDTRAIFNNVAENWFSLYEKMGDYRIAVQKYRESGCVELAFPFEYRMNYYSKCKSDDSVKQEPGRKYLDVNIRADAGDIIKTITNVKLYDEQGKEMPNSAVGYSIVISDLIIPIRNMNASIYLPIRCLWLDTTRLRIYFDSETETLPTFVNVQLIAQMFQNDTMARIIRQPPYIFWMKNLYNYYGTCIARVKNLPAIPSEKVIEQVGNEAMITLDHCDMDSLKVEPSDVAVLINGEKHQNNYTRKFDDPWVKTLKITTVGDKPFTRISYREVALDYVFYGEFV